MIHRLAPMMNQLVGVELIYAIIIIAISLMIYFLTREVYKLSSHKGIKYFREAFLFFALAFFFRFVVNTLFITRRVHHFFDLVPRIFGMIAGLFFMYASLIALFYLLYAIIWKHFKNKTWVFHIIALTIAVLTVITRNLFLILMIQLVVLVVMVSLSLIKHKKGHFHILYLLLFVFGMLNIIGILIPGFMITLQLTIYVASIILFFLILYKVMKTMMEHG